MKEKLKKLVAGAALLATLAAPGAAKAGGSAEIMAGDKKATIDLKVNTNLAPRTNMFLRGMTGVDYDNNVDYFGLADVSFNIVGGLDALVDTQYISGAGFVPRAGLQYFKKVGDLTMYGNGTVKLGEDPDGEFVVNLGYTPKINKAFSIVLDAENVTSVGKKGHNFSVQRLRAGVGYKKHSVGAAVDVTEAGGEVKTNVGGFYKVRF
jgi:hypothetical protein